MSKREELEKRIREQRVLEANKKGFVGTSGKIGTVLMIMGQEVVSHEEGGAQWWEEPGDSVEESESSEELMRRIPTMGIDDNVRPSTPEWSELNGEIHVGTRRIGMHFDGLGMGMHMEIMYNEDKSELSLTHKGFLAYREVMGEIDTYVPNDEWEGWIEKLYKASKKKQRSKKEDDFKNKAEDAEKSKEAWWDLMRKKWGKF